MQRHQTQTEQKDLNNITPHGHLEYPKTEEIKEVKLGMRGELKKAIKFGNIDLPKSKVIIQPTLEKDVFIITPYAIDPERKQSNLPEAERCVIPGQSYFVTFDEQHPSHKYLKFNDEHYKKVNVPLFPDRTSPSIDEIKQMFIPDCGLLAAIQAILTHPNGASFIRGMMHQDENGMIIVRLFNAKTGQPEFVKVESAVLVDNKERFLNGHTALWVHALESAFAARGIKGEDTVIDQSVSTGCAFVDPKIAFKVLTGLSSSSITIDLHKKDVAPYHLPEFLSEECQTIIEVNKKFPAEQKEKILKQVLSSESFMPTLYSVFPELKEEEVLSNYTKLVLLQQSDKDRFNQLTEGKPVEEDQALAQFYGAIKKAYKPAGAPFANAYNVYQLEVFKMIEQALLEEKLLVAGTKNKFEKPIDGFHNQHGYTIMGVVKRDINGRSACFIKLRNPWGLSGRYYDLTTLKGFENKKSAIFELELSEFCEHVLFYTVSDSAKQSFERDDLKEKCLIKVENFLRTDRMDGDRTKKALQNEYRDCVDFQRELIHLELHLSYPHLLQNLKEREAVLISIIGNNINSTLKQAEKFEHELFLCTARINGEFKTDNMAKDIEDAMINYFALKQSHALLGTLTIFTEIDKEIIEKLHTKINALNELLTQYEKGFNEHPNNNVKVKFIEYKNHYEKKLQQAFDIENPVADTEAPETDSLKKAVIGVQHFGLLPNPEVRIWLPSTLGKLFEPTNPLNRKGR